MAQATQPKAIDASRLLSMHAFTVFLLIWEMKKAKSLPSLAWRDIRRYKSLNGIAASPDQWDQAARVVMRTGLAAAIGIEPDAQGYA